MASDRCEQRFGLPRPFVPLSRSLVIVLGPTMPTVGAEYRRTSFQLSCVHVDRLSFRSIDCSFSPDKLSRVTSTASFKDCPPILRMLIIDIAASLTWTIASLFPIPNAYELWSHLKAVESLITVPSAIYMVTGLSAINRSVYDTEWRFDWLLQLWSPLQVIENSCMTSWHSFAIQSCRSVNAVNWPCIIASSCK